MGFVWGPVGLRLGARVWAPGWTRGQAVSGFGPIQIPTPRVARVEIASWCALPMWCGEREDGKLADAGRASWWARGQEGSDGGGGWKRTEPEIAAGEARPEPLRGMAIGAGCDYAQGPKIRTAQFWPQSARWRPPCDALPASLRANAPPCHLRIEPRPHSCFMIKPCVLPSQLLFAAYTRSPSLNLSTTRYKPPQMSQTGSLQRFGAMISSPLGPICTGLAFELCSATSSEPFQMLCPLRSASEHSPFRFMLLTTLSCPGTRLHSSFARRIL